MINKTRIAWQNITSRSVFIQYFAALFLTALLAVLIMAFISYTFSSSSLVEQISKQRTNALIQTKNTADIALKEIEKLLIGKTVDPVFNKAIPNTGVGKYEAYNKIAKILVECRNTNENIYSVYYYIPYQNCVITSEDGRWNAEKFYDTGWMDAYKEQRGNGWLSSRRIDTNIGEKQNIFSFLMPVQTENSSDGGQTLLVVNVKEDRFSELMQDKISSESENTLIIDEYGKVITNDYDSKQFGEPDLISDLNSVTVDANGYLSQLIGREKYLISYTRSEYNKWKYICLTPENEVTRPASYIRVVIIVASGLVILLGALAAMMTTRKMYKPISDFLKVAKNHNKGVEKISENEIVYLNKEFGKILEKNRDLNDTLQKSEWMLREGFIHDLLVNEPLDEDNLLQKSKQCNSIFRYDEFIVLLFGMDKLSLFYRTKEEKKRRMFLIK
jgi:hypothetical protein